MDSAADDGSSAVMAFDSSAGCRNDGSSSDAGENGSAKLQAEIGADYDEPGDIHHFPPRENFALARWGKVRQKVVKTHATSASKRPDLEVEASIGDRMMGMALSLLDVDTSAMQKSLHYSSLFCLKPYSPLRRAVMRLVSNVWFDRVVLLLIMSNSALLATNDPLCIGHDGLFDRSEMCGVNKTCHRDVVDSHPCDGPFCAGWESIHDGHTCDPSFQHWMEVADVIFSVSQLWIPTHASRLTHLRFMLQVLFTLEMMLKVIVSGFVLHPGSYLREVWNRLDFFIVIMSWVNYAPATSNLQAIRVVRVLRPLRSLARVNGMSLLVSALLEAMTPLLDVVALLLVFILIFGIVGINLFQGRLHSRCVYTNRTLPEQPGGGYRACDTLTPSCGGLNDSVTNASLVCVNNYTAFPNLEVRLSQWIHFDDFGGAFITVFQVITQESWTRIMYTFEDVVEPAVADVFFCCLVILGNWFMLSFFIAILAEEYEKQKIFKMAEEARKAEARKRMRKKLSKHVRQRVSIQRLKRVTSASPLSRGASFNRSFARAGSVKMSSNEPDIRFSPARSRGLSRSNSFLLKLGDDVPSSESQNLSDSGDPTDEPSWLSSFCLRVISHSRFSSMMTLCVLANTVFLALEHHDQELFEANYLEQLRLGCRGDSEGELVDANGSGCPVASMSQTLSDVMANGNIAICVMFALEMALKLIGGGLRQYTRSKFNIFEGVVVVASLLELALDAMAANRLITNTSAASALRSFRMLRFFKFARSWVSLRRILYTFKQAMSTFAPLALILFTFMYIMALLGMQLFGGRLESNPSDFDFFRSNFDQMLPSERGYGAFVSIFQILTLEGWSRIMYEALDETSGANFIFFLVVICVGQFVIFNLFLTILLSGFADAGLTITESSGADADEDDGYDFGADMLNIIGAVLRRMRALCLCLPPIAAQSSVLPSAGPSSADADGDAEAFGPALETVVVIVAARPSYWESTRIRKISLRLVSHPLFDPVSLFFIFVSACLVAVQQPQWDETHPTYYPFRVCDIAFAAIFTLELLLKVFAYGAFHGDRACFRDPWISLDVFIVSVSILGLSFEHLRPLRTLRVFRAFRPLRIIKRLAGLRIIVHCLLRSMPSMLQVTSVVLLLFFVFAILGTSLFKGKLYYCTNMTDPKQYRRLVLNWRQCEEEGFQWLVRRSNFNSVLQSMRTLFEVATLSGWPDIMNSGLDSPSQIGLMPQPMRSPVYVLYFLLFILVGTFFGVNLFTGIVIQNYSVCKRMEDSHEAVLVELDRSQAQWISLVQQAMRTKPMRRHDSPSSRIHAALLGVCEHKYFEYSILACVLLNVAMLASDHLQATLSYTRFTEYTNLALTFIFVLELGLKLVAFSPVIYWQDAWNKFDTVIVAISLVDAIVALVELGSKGVSLGGDTSSGFAAFGTLKVLRVFRVSRVFRLLKSAKNLRRLLATLAHSIPDMLNTFCLTGIVVAVYAILGQQFFWNVRPGAEINEDRVHFKDFPSAFLLLIRISSGENWNAIMHDCSSGLCRSCDGDPGDCGGCGGLIAPFFFISYKILCDFVMVNLIVPVVLDYYRQSAIAERADVPRENLEDFEQVWSHFDPDATGELPTYMLAGFIQRLNAPLGAARTTVIKQRKQPGLMWRLRAAVNALGAIGEHKDEMPGENVNAKKPVVTQRKPPPNKRLRKHPSLRKRRTIGIQETSDRKIGSKNDALRIMKEVRDHLPDREGNVLYYDVYYALLHRVVAVDLPSSEASKLQERHNNRLNKKGAPSSITASACETMAATKLQSLFRARRARKRTARIKAEQGQHEQSTLSAGMTPDDGGIAPDDGAMAPNDEGMAPDDESMARDDRGVPPDDRGGPSKLRADDDTTRCDSGVLDDQQARGKALVDLSVLVEHAD